MMRRITVFAVFCAVVACATAVQAVPVFYLSTESSGSPVAGDLALTGIAANSTGTLNVWCDSDVRLSGVSLDLVETGGFIKFMAPVTVANPAGPPARWAFLDGPQVITNSSVTNFGGAALPGLSGDGVGAGSTAGNKVLLGSVGYMALANNGTSQLQLRVGSNGIADWDSAFAPVKFGSATDVNVPGDAFGMGNGVGSIQVGAGGGPLPVITPVALGEVNQITNVVANLVASNGPITWSGLTPTPGVGSPALAATLTPQGAFSWNPAGSARGPKGNGRPYSWTATATNATGATTGVAITLSLIPEPATVSLLGLAMVGTLGLVRRRS